MKALKMPQSLRPILAKGVGKVVKGSKPEETSAKLVNELRKCIHIVAVGDVVCTSLLNMNRVPDICVVDGKTKRGPYRLPSDILKTSFNAIMRVRNPASHITEEAFQALENAWRYVKSDRKTLIVVEGEEDMLALAASAIMDPGSCILYGVPDIGVSVIMLDEALKNEAVGLLRMFEEVDV